MTFTSYAQNQEDVLLHRVFGGQETGFYIDVGAYDPVIGSVTKAFYDRGWSGINIEPGQVFEKLAADRPRDVNLRLAVLDRTGEVQYSQNMADAGMSHVVDQTDGVTEAVTISCDTLENIVRDHSDHRPVDFIKIDAEGAEAAIIRSTDWQRLRPRVLLIEATLPWSSTLSNQDWEPKLVEQGYRRVYFDGINCFYVPEEEEAALGRLFKAPVNVLDRCKPYDPAAEAVVRERDELFARISTISSDFADLEARLAAEVSRHEANVAARLAKAAMENDAKVAAVHRECEFRVSMIVAERDKLLTRVEALAEERERQKWALETNEAGHTVELQASAEERDRYRQALVSAQEAYGNAVGAIADRDRRIELLNDELAAANAQCVSLVARLRPPPVETVTPVSEVAIALPRRPVHTRILRRIARGVYRLVRPVVRPTVWRLRSFMLLPMTDHLQAFNASQVRLAAEFQAAREGDHITLRHDLHRLHGEITKPRSQSAETEQMPVVVQVEPAGLAEMRSLAEKLEQAMLTLMVSSTLQAPMTVPPPPPSTALLLPGERRIEIETVPGDVSLAGALTASGGMWEPHVQRYLSELIRPDWVCLDIGANIGVHTLCLATLAHQGAVYAFEADPTNFAVLSRNVDNASSPVGDIEVLHLALWDRPGTLVVGGANELSGCSFVSEDGVDEAEVETLLRSVVSADALSSTSLHVRRAEVEAIPLDDWSEGLMRLDFIKLDVEGAEAFVVRGADRTLWRHRPVLLVEYNPACAAAYFNQQADVLFHELTARFASVHALQEDGSLVPLPDWDTLKTRLESGKGWEDVVCLPASN